MDTAGEGLAVARAKKRVDQVMAGVTPARENLVRNVTIGLDRLVGGGRIIASAQEG
jgi:hypothetical protein